jgi:hypothetical protein
VDAGAVVAPGWLACAIGDAVGVAACPTIDVPIIATIATPTAMTPIAPTVVLRFTLFIPRMASDRDSLG